MKNLLKSSISLFLAVTIIFSSSLVGINELKRDDFFALKTLAADSYELVFELNKDGTYGIAGCFFASGEIVIPSTYNNIPVTSINDDAFSDCSKITSIIIPDSITSIGNWAFFNCYGLTSITIPDSVTEIGSSAFYSCTNLKSVIIGNGITEINSELFFNCWKLMSVVIPDGVTRIGSGAFKMCHELASVIIPDSVTSIGSSAFELCYALKSIAIPDSVTKIDKNAFANCTGLEAVYITDLSSWCNIEFKSDWANPIYYSKKLYLYDELITDLVVPADVKNIGDYTFCGYTALTSITIPDNVTSIGKYTFSGCTELTSITIPDSVTSVGEYAFGGCRNLKSISIHDNITYLGRLCFYFTHYYGDQSNWKDDVLYLNNYLLQAKKSLTGDFKIPDGTKLVADSAFSDCTGITSINIPDSMTVLCDSAFSGCKGLTSIVIPDGVKSIGKSVFSGCNSLTNIIIPDSVKSIGYLAFVDCTNLNTIVLGNGLESIGNHAFRNTGYYNNTDNWVNDVLYIDAHLIKANDTLTGAYEIKNGTKSIAASAFFNCDKLTSVVIPDSVKNLDLACFSYCARIETITLGNGVTNIGERAFYDCPKVSSIIIPDSVTNIGERAFGFFVVSASQEKVDGFTIYAKKGTEAEKYANEYGFAFVNVCEHKTIKWTIDKKATVYKAGSKCKECAECGEILETAEIPQLKCSKPKLSKIENTEYGVKITWGKVSGADKYYVYRKTGSSGKYSRIGSTTKTYYTDKTAKSGKKYYYIVKAVNEAGSSSSSSSLSKLYLADTTLSIPKSTKSGITLKWKKVTGADGYMVYRKTGTGSYSKIATVKGNSKVTYTDKTAKKGKTYTYKIKAYKSKTYSAYSNTKKIKDKY